VYNYIYDDILSSLKHIESEDEKSNFIEKKLAELRKAERSYLRSSKKFSRLEKINEKFKFHENIHIQRILLLESELLSKN
jgi:hypothetical protein